MAVGRRQSGGPAPHKSISGGYFAASNSADSRNSVPPPRPLRLIASSRVVRRSVPTTSHVVIDSDGPVRVRPLGMASAVPIRAASPSWSFAPVSRTRRLHWRGGMLAGSASEAT